MDLEKSETERELRIDWNTHKGVEINGVQCDLLIRDVPKKWNSRICEYMLENSYRTNIIYKHLKFEEDPELEQIYLNVVNHILRNECSFMAIDEGTNEIFGVALLKRMTEEWRSWINWVIYLENGKLCDFLKNQYECVQEYQKAHPEKPVDTLHLFEYHINDELKKDEQFVKKFFDAVRETARHMRMPRATFFASRLEEQQTAQKVGFQVLSTVIYSFVRLKTGRRPYQTLRTINETCMVLYEAPVEPLTRYFDLLPPFVTDENDRKKFQEQLQKEEEDREIFAKKRKEAEMKKEEEKKKKEELQQNQSGQENWMSQVEWE